jgi:hypothetical protein
MINEMKNGEPTKLPHPISPKGHLILSYNLGLYSILFDKPLVIGTLVFNHPIIKD